jgi:ankyrin repeat protein
LQLDQLLKSSSVSKIRRALETLPTTLDTFYDRTLTEIDEEEQHRAFVALQWLAFSSRPLSLSELAEAIIIQPRQDPCFDPEERFMHENDVLNILPAGLVRKVFREQPEEDSRWSSKGEAISYIEFAHFSVLEYLKSSRMSSELRPKYQIEEIKAHNMIAEACLAYLLYIGETEQTLAEEMYTILQTEEQAREETEDDEEGESEDHNEQLEGDSSGRIAPTKSRLELCRQLDDHYPLAAYANRAWHYSYRMSQIQSDKNEYLDKLAMDFLNDNGNPWTIWFCFVFDNSFFLYMRERLLTYLASGWYIPDRKPKISPVIWISWLGLPSLLELMLKRSPNLSKLETTSYFGSPLHAAASSGDQQIVQILLFAQADVNERGGLHLTPLAAASSAGSFEVVKLLLEAGADVNAQAKDQSALIAASRAGSIEVVKLLLEAGADVGLQAKDQSALIAASSAGSIEVVKLLLEAGAGVNIQAEDQSALIAASSAGSMEVVKLLLEAGADVNVQAEDQSALIAASSAGSIEVVKLLLEAGADVSLQAKDQSALIAACKSGSVEVVPILLDAGAHIGSKQEPAGAYVKAVEKYEDGSKNNYWWAPKFLKIIGLLDAHLGKQQALNIEDRSTEPECPPLYA